MLEAVLVQNTAWSSVRRTSDALGVLRTPQAIAGMSDDELASRIRSCGFAARKARTIRALTAWYAAYGYEQRTVQAAEQSRLRDELLALPGVGAETADVILVYAFYKPSFILDAYTRRWLTRLGFGDDDGQAVFRIGSPARRGALRPLSLAHSRPLHRALPENALLRRLSVCGRMQSARQKRLTAASFLRMVRPLCLPFKKAAQSCGAFFHLFQRLPSSVRTSMLPLVVRSRTSRPPLCPAGTATLPEVDDAVKR
ncbi:MAG: hypothetical protein ACLUFV_01830 [Acutalibacteraceae bacterium]